MNLALPALVLFYLALPGFLLVKAFRGRTALKIRDEPVVNLAAMTPAFVMALALDPALHALWIGITHSATGFRVNLDAVAFLIAGDYDGQRRFERAMGAATRSHGAVIVYFSTLYAFALYLGSVCRMVVRKKRLDLQYPWLRFGNDWFYLFDPPVPEDQYHHGIRVAATLDQGGASYVYTGLLESYAMTPEGNLERLVLKEPVYRRPLLRVRMTGSRERHGDTGRYYPIEGDHLILWARDIKSLNIDFIYLIPEDEVDLAEGAGATVSPDVPQPAGWIPG